MIKKNKLIQIQSLFVLFLLLSVFFAAPAFAISLGEAKSKGYVGEQANGYLGIVSDKAPAEVREMVNNINSKRRGKYKSIAKRNKHKPDVIEKLAGEKLINRTEKGKYFLSPQGGWKKK